MNLSKLFSLIFAAIGMILMVAVLFLCLLFRNAEPKLAEIPAEAGQCTQNMMDALTAGDYLTVQTLLYGQPELGLSTAPTGKVAARVWKAMPGALGYSFPGDCYMEGTTVCRDVDITYLDARGISDALPGLAKNILNAKAASGEDISAFYTEAGQLRPEAADSILQEAVAEAIAAAQQVQCQSKLQLTEKDGRWYVIPDAHFFTAISGGVA